MKQWAAAWGSAQEFAWLYGSFLDAVYRSDEHPDPGDGRRALAESIADELTSRRVRRVLDCSAGTGFPALDLVELLPSQFEMRCTDASPEMLGVLRARARRKGIDPKPFAPRRRPEHVTPNNQDPLILDWSNLDHLDGTFDYVMCRGNSLVYANSWGPDGQAVASIGRIEEDLKKMAERVRPGGYLHIDAPRKLGLSEREYAAVASGALKLIETVKPTKDYRKWRVDFKLLPTDQTLKFELFSTLLTIHNVRGILKKMDFESTELVELPHERPGFGVIIARKPIKG